MRNPSTSILLLRLSISLLLVSPVAVYGGSIPDITNLKSDLLMDGVLPEGEPIPFTAYFRDSDGGVQVQNVFVNISFSGKQLIRLQYYYDDWTVLEGNKYCYIHHAGSRVDGDVKILNFTVVFRQLPFIQPPNPPQKYVELELALKALDSTGLETQWCYYLREVQLTRVIESEPTDSEIRQDYNDVGYVLLFLLIPAIAVIVILYGMSRKRKRTYDLIPTPDPYTFNP